MILGIYIPVQFSIDLDQLFSTNPRLNGQTDERMNLMANGDVAFVIGFDVLQKSAPVKNQNGGQIYEN